MEKEFWKFSYSPGSSINIVIKSIVILHCFFQSFGKLSQLGESVSSIFCQHYLVLQKQKPWKTLDLYGAINIRKYYKAAESLVER